jgi:hypothetical protein
MTQAMTYDQLEKALLDYKIHRNEIPPPRAYTTGIKFNPHWVAHWPVAAHYTIKTLPAIFSVPGPPLRDPEIESWPEETRCRAEAVLRRAKELITRGWTQLTPAQDEFCASCDVRSDWARKFCLMGAIARACVDFQSLAVWNSLCDVLWTIGPIRASRSPVDWNDSPGRTQQEVLDVLHLAIGRVALGK